MKQLLLFGVLVFALNVSAQDTSYSRIYEPVIGELDYNYPVSDASIVWDDGLLTSGLLSTGLNRSYLARISPSGSLLWQKRFGDNSIPDDAISFNQLIATHDSSFVAIGVFTDTVAQENRPFCMKLNADGDTLWTRAFNLTNQPIGSFQNIHENNGKVIEAFDSTLILGFHHASFDQSLSNPDHLCLVNMDLNGNMLWSKSFMTDSSFYIREIVQAEDSSLFIVGQSNEDQRYGSLLHVASDGQLIWSKKYSGIRFDDIEVDSNHLYISWANGLNTSPSHGLLKLDMDGHFVKRVSFYVGTNDSRGLNTVRRSNGNLVTTTMDFYWNFSHGFYELTNDLSYVQSFDAFMMMDEVIAIPNKGIYAIGFGPTYGVKAGNVEMGIVRLDSSMYENWGCVNPISGDVTILDSVSWNSGVFTQSSPIISYQPNLTYENVDFIEDEGCVTFLGSVSEIEGSWNETVSPNPSTGAFTIDWNEYREADVKIYNSIGEEVYRSSVKDSLIDIHLVNQKEGMYFYQLIDSNGHKSTGKLVVTK